MGRRTLQCYHHRDFVSAVAQDDMWCLPTGRHALDPPAQQRFGRRSRVDVDIRQSTNYGEAQKLHLLPSRSRRHCSISSRSTTRLGTDSAQRHHRKIRPRLGHLVFLLTM